MIRARSVSLLVLALCVCALAGCTSARQRQQPGWAHFVDQARLVRASKRSYQLGTGKPRGTAVTWRDLATSLPAHWKPSCPQGGRVLPGRLGEEIVCTVHGQLVDSSYPRKGVRQP